VKAASGAAIACLPAFAGIYNYRKIHRRIEQLTGMLIYEMTVLPPSILGMRIDNAMRRAFASMGGVFIAGDRVMGGEISDDRIGKIFTANIADGISADNYVLAAGSFFSGGLVSEFDAIKEPVFGLRLQYDRSRSEWRSHRFFDTAGHPFLEYGVMTDENLRPSGSNGRIIENLFCAGSILSHYDPIKEGCGAGVAIATGYRTAKIIIGDGNG
jgi:glycerol-3-phosphate dehydrogenase subunit B